MEKYIARNKNKARSVRQMLQDPRWEAMGAFKVIGGLVRSGQARDMFWRQRWQNLLMEWIQVAGGRWGSVARNRVGVPGMEPENLEEWSVICWNGENDDERRGAGLWRKNKEFVCTHCLRIPRRPSGDTKKATGSPIVSADHGRSLIYKPSAHRW